MNIINARNLALWYGDNKALKEVSISIPEKSITAFIGPSGCGKSTFLKTLNRMNDLIPSVKITGDIRYMVFLHVFLCCEQNSFLC